MDGDWVVRVRRWIVDGTNVGLLMVDDSRRLKLEVVGG